MLNRATGKERLGIGAVAMVILVPVILWLNDIGLAVHLSRAGQLVEGEITARDPNPKDRRAYSTFQYSYGGVEHVGSLGGASGYAVGDKIELTIAPENPAEYWVGDASSAVRSLVISSVMGAAWLSLGVAFLMRLPSRKSEP